MDTRIWFTNDAGYINIEVTYEEGATYDAVCAAATKALKEDKHFNSWSIFDFKKDSPTQTTFHAEY